MANPSDLSFFSAVEIPPELLNFDYITQVIYDQSTFELSLEYKSGAIKSLGTVESTVARSVIAANVDVLGELTLTFSNGTSINVGRVVTDVLIDNTQSYSGRGYHIGNNDYLPILSGDGATVSDINDLNITFSQITLPPNTDIDTTPLYQYFAHFTEDRMGDTQAFNTLVANAWHNRQIQNVITDNINIVNNPDSLSLDVGTYYVIYRGVHYNTTSVKLAVRDSDSNILLESTPIHNYSTRITNSHVPECAGYFALSDPKEIYFSYITSSTNVNTRVPVTLHVESFVNDGYKVTAEIFLWKLADDVLEVPPEEQLISSLSAYSLKLSEVYSHVSHLPYTIRNANPELVDDRVRPELYDNHYKYYHSYKSSSNKIYFIGDYHLDVIEYDIDSHSYQKLDFGRLSTHTITPLSKSVMKEDVVYYSPDKSGNMFKVDLSSQQFISVAHGLTLSSHSFSSMCVGADNKIYLIPDTNSTPEVMVLDTTNDTAVLLSIPSTINTGWTTASIDKNGIIYAVPFHSTNGFLIIDTNNQTVSIDALSTTFIDGEFSSSILVDSKIYFIPVEYNQRILVLDTVSITTEVIADASGTISENSKGWISANLGKDNNIYCMPYATDISNVSQQNNILIIDTKYKSINFVKKPLDYGIGYDSNYRYSWSTLSLFNGKLIGAPMVGINNIMHLLIDTDPNSEYYGRIYGDTMMGTLVDAEYEFTHGTVSLNNRIYIPTHSSSGTNRTLVIDANEKVSYFTNGGDSGGVGILGNDGRYYIIPQEKYGYIIDPKTDVATITDFSPPSAISSLEERWIGAVYGSNGMIYTIPYEYNSVMVIDAKNNTSTFNTYGLDLTDSKKWKGGVVGGDGYIYGIPYNANDFLIIDPATNTATRKNLGSFFTGEEKYSCGVLAQDGLIYCFPEKASNILVIDTANEASYVTTFSYNFGDAGNVTGVCLGRNGKYYLSRSYADSCLEVDVFKQEINEIGGIPMDPLKYNYSSVTSDINGNIYFIPRDGSAIQVLEFNSDGYESFSNIITSPHNNKR